VSRSARTRVSPIASLGGQKNLLVAEFFTRGGTGNIPPPRRRALANEPTLLLADEPTGALDSEGGEEVIELLRRLHGGGQTIVLITHDAGVAAAAGRVVRMRDGRIVEPEPELQPDGGTVVIEAL
jgi:hypothetical protein